MRPASTSSGGEADDGDDCAPGALLAPVAGVFGTAAAGTAEVAGAGSACASFALPAALAVGLAAGLAAFALAAFAALAGFGLAAAGAPFAPSASAVAGLALELDPFAAAGFAVEAEDFGVVGDFAVEDFGPAARTVRADVAVRAVGLAAVVALERAAVVVDDGIALDIALAASVSALTAVSIVLVAALIACSAVVMVLAEDVACAAAVFSFAAADVTLVAADDTVRAVGAVVVRLAVAGPAELLVPVPALADPRAVVPLDAGLAAAGVVVFFAPPAVDDFAELVRLALAVRGRVGFLAAGVVGTDLPPSGSVTGSLIPRNTKLYTSRLSAHQSQQALPHPYTAPGY